MRETLAKSDQMMRPTGRDLRPNWSVIGLRSRGTHSICLLLAVLIILATATDQTLAQERRIPPDLTELSLEELLNIEVTSVSRAEKPLFESAAAIYVITADEIRHSGVTSIPGALRLVPGLSVAQVDGNKWAISARGFNRRFANKLLVMIDGRSVYTPHFGGVYWEVQDVLLEDIDRIEVIRGPGATLWGANAVNGVINVVTKVSKQTQGGMLTAGGGTEERGFAGARYGGGIGETIHYRVYGKYFNRDEQISASGGNAADGGNVLRGGFRVDWDPTGNDEVMLLGGMYTGDLGRTVRQSSLLPPFELTIDEIVDVSGVNALARWKHEISGTSEARVQLYYDRTLRNDVTVHDKLSTVDVDLQHSFALGARQSVVWGAKYRYSIDDIQGGFSYSVTPNSRTTRLASAFVQDEIELVAERLRLTLGSKFEQNDFTGFEYQPSIKLFWAPRRNHALWGAVSRAVRTPARGEEDLRINGAVFPGQGGGLSIISVFGNPELLSEKLTAYEIGYRVRPSRQLSIDLATFYNRYGDLLSVEPGIPYLEMDPAPAHMVLPQSFENLAWAESYGLEASLVWKVSEEWRMELGYTGLNVRVHLDPTSQDEFVGKTAGKTPNHQLNLRSDVRIRPNISLTTALTFVDALPTYGLPSRWRADARMGWALTDALELSVAAKNLLDPSHLEFGQTEDLTQATLVQRSLYGKLTWYF